MQSLPAFGYEQIFTEIVRGVVDTVTAKSDMSPARKAASQETAVCSVMAFNPRDPVETMLAGQCVVYDHLLRDGARDLLRGQAELLMIQARPGVLAAGKIFLSTLGMLLRMQRRPGEMLAFGRPVAVKEETPKQAEAAPPAAAKDPSPLLHEEAPRPTDAPPVEPVVDLTMPPSDSPAPVRLPTERGPTSRQTLSPALIEQLLVDSVDPALREEIMAAARLASAGVR